MLRCMPSAGQRRNGAAWCDSISHPGACMQQVITVPAYFNEVQRQATLQAALAAGLKQTQLLQGDWRASSMVSAPTPSLLPILAHLVDNLPVMVLTLLCWQIQSRWLQQLPMG